MKMDFKNKPTKSIFLVFIFSEIGSLALGIFRFYIYFNADDVNFQIIKTIYWTFVPCIMKKWGCEQTTTKKETKHF